MFELLIGTGGWAYFQVPGFNRLEAYSSVFNFVEVNSTFYEMPSLQIVKSWRRRAPSDFNFSIRCHKDMTHIYQLEPIEEVFNVFNTMKEICKIVGSKFLVIVTPSVFNFNKRKTDSIKNFFESIDLDNITLVWEIRRRQGESIPNNLISLIQDYNIIHCVDLSKETPVIDSNIIYTRIFGKGEKNIYQFTDIELLEIDQKISKEDRDEAIVSFHNVKMYKDAARYKIYRATQNFPPVTEFEGKQSLKEVLIEDAEFPATKAELIKDQGWKVIDLTSDVKIHAYYLLNTLPKRRFMSIEAVLTSLP